MQGRCRRRSGCRLCVILRMGGGRTWWGNAVACRRRGRKVWAGGGWAGPREWGAVGRKRGADVKRGKYKGKGARLRRRPLQERGMSGLKERFLFACAPDSWGVLDYPGPSWEQSYEKMLDEMVEAGYKIGRASGRERV